MKSECRKPSDKFKIGLQIFKNHEEMATRLTKTLYYGESPGSDRSSLAMTGVAVPLFAKAVPRGLGGIDMYYASDITRNACVSPCSLIMAMVYLDRLRYRNPDYLKTISSSDLFLVSMMVASKFLFDEGEDEEVFNDEWAASANMETWELNKLERNFLAAMSWDIFVSNRLLEDTLRRIESQVALQEGLNRGWFSYTDLDIISTNSHTMQQYLIFLVQTFVKVIAVCTVAYTAAILTMIGSKIAGCCIISALDLPSSFHPSSSASNTGFALHNNLEQANTDLPSDAILDSRFALPGSLGEAESNTSGLITSSILNIYIDFDWAADFGTTGSLSTIPQGLPRQFNQMNSLENFVVSLTSQEAMIESMTMTNHCNASIHGISEFKSIWRFPLSCHI